MQLKLHDDGVREATFVATGLDTEIDREAEAIMGAAWLRRTQRWIDDRLRR